MRMSKGSRSWGPRRQECPGARWAAPASKIGAGGDAALFELARHLVIEEEAHARILPAEDFRHALQTERSRADRTGTHLSVILLWSDLDGEDPDDFLGGLQDRLRGEDTVCPLTGGPIVALLPDTTRAGAQAVLQRVLPQDGWNTPACRALVYPDDAWVEWSGARAPPSEAVERGGVDPALYPIGKRVFDVLGASLALLLLSPLLLLLSLWVQLTSPGPVFFHQTRVGLGGRPFEMLKFRTMHVGRQAVDGHRKHARAFIENDAPMPKASLPLIPGGWLLRALCLDELPQFVNVLRGDMTLVGPRPCVPYEAEAYKQWHRRRFSLMPGITGLWQVSGKNRLTFNQMVRLDIQYARRLSWSYDLLIIARTPIAIVREMVLSAREHRSA